MGDQSSMEQPEYTNSRLEPTNEELLAENEMVVELAALHEYLDRWLPVIEAALDRYRVIQAMAKHLPTSGVGLKVQESGSSIYFKCRALHDAIKKAAGE